MKCLGDSQTVSESRAIYLLTALYSTETGWRRLSSLGTSCEIRSRALMFSMRALRALYANSAVLDPSPPGHASWSGDCKGRCQHVP